MGLRWNIVCFQILSDALDDTGREGERRTKMRDEDPMKEK
jgi:hypothetical protein